MKHNQPLTGTSAADARADFEAKLRTDLTDRYRTEGSGLSQEAAEAKAAADAASQMKTLAALHTPDMFAGGTNAITDIGDRSVNSSIGSQWKGRVNGLDDAAKAVPTSERTTTRMNAKLERCK